jgi:hypothetical protein
MGVSSHGAELSAAKYIKSIGGLHDFMDLDAALAGVVVTRMEDR